VRVEQGELLANTGLICVALGVLPATCSAAKPHPSGLAASATAYSPIQNRCRVPQDGLTADQMYGD
jgi:hypothetical protein